LTDELLATPEQADLDECKSLITLAIKGIDRQLSDYGFGRNLIIVSVKGIDRKISVWVFDRFREKKRMETTVKKIKILLKHQFSMFIRHDDNFH
jgi:hypothetical protein